MNKFYFSVPLKSYKESGEESAKLICRNLNASLCSIANSAEKSGKFEVEVFVSSHENPFDDYPGIFNFPESLKINLIVNNFDRPVDKSQYMKDKRRKKNAIFEYMLRNGLVESDEDFYLMPFDADDVVALSFFNDLEKVLVEEHDDICFMSGFVYDKKNLRVGFLDGVKKRFFKNCGTCYITKLKGRDLVAPDGAVFRFNNHSKYPDISQGLGRKVVYSYFPALCYVVNHGENDSSLRHGENHFERYVRGIALESGDANLDFFEAEFPGFKVRVK